MKPLILIGGGGHCKACIDIIEQLPGYTILGILDQEKNVEKNLLGYPILGTDSDLLSYINTCDFLITIGQIQSPDVREIKWAYLQKHGASLATIISPTAQVSRHATVHPGTIIMHHAVVNAGATIKENCIINTHAIIEHDAHVGAHSHVSTGAIVNGGCKIGKGVFIGSQAMISHGVSISNNTLIGAATPVLRDIKSFGTYVGNPMRKLSK